MVTSPIRKKGFTLAELLVTLAIFAILAGSILATFALAAGYWNSGNSENDAKEAARLSLETIGDELSQAVLDPDPFTGYLTISPALSTLNPPYNTPTAFLLPNGNAGQQVSTSVLFDEVNYANCVFPCPNPGSTPSNYKQIDYTTAGGTLQRTETTYNTLGSVVSTRTDTVVQLKNGTLQLQATYISNEAVTLQVTASTATETYILSSEVFMPGSESP